jgi:DNA repair protein RecO
LAILFTLKLIAKATFRVKINIKIKIFIALIDFFFMFYFKINGLILSKKNIKENSSLVYILTKDFGKIKTTVEGINKPESKLLSIIQPGTFGRFFIINENNNYKVLSCLPLKIPIKVFSISPYQYLWALKLLSSFNFLEISDNFWNMIYKLDYFLLKNKFSFLLWFLLKIFDELGMQINWYSCVNCLRPLDKLKKDVFYKKSSFYCFICRKIAYEKIEFKIYLKIINLIKKDSILDLKDKKIISLIKKIIKSHLKEIRL